MEAEELIRLCLSRRGATLDRPFGETPICAKVCGHIFAEIYPDPGSLRVTLKCEPLRADEYRRRFPGRVVAGYHVPNRQKPYRNTVCPGGALDDEILCEMLEHSYAEVVKTLRVRDREALNRLPPEKPKKATET